MELILFRKFSRDGFFFPLLCLCSVFLKVGFLLWIKALEKHKMFCCFLSNASFWTFCFIQFKKRDCINILLCVCVCAWKSFGLLVSSKNLQGLAVCSSVQNNLSKKNRRSGRRANRWREQSSCKSRIIGLCFKVILRTFLCKHIFFTSTELLETFRMTVLLLLKKI